MNSTSSDPQAVNEDAPETSSPGRYRRLRVWPAVVLLVGMALARLIPGLIQNGPANIWMVSAFGPLACGILIALWWLLFSRAAMNERIIGFLGLIIAAVATQALVDKSMLGPATMVLTMPMGIAGFAISTIVLSGMLAFRRTVIALLLASCGFGFSTLLKSDGLWGNFALELRWRWQTTSEDRVVANSRTTQSDAMSQFEATDVDKWLSNPEWPAFRGVDRASRARGAELATNWSASPPEQLWKIDVGPGWSSFAVAGSLLFTQEQRGEMETVVCYRADTGTEIWTQQIESRFEDTLGGPGPRATPTIADESLFALGAAGHLLRLDPRTGDIVWQADLRKSSDRDPPMWGFCSSPLVTEKYVIVHAGGKGDKGTLAFDVSTGELKWSAPSGDHSYSSPQLSTVAGELFVLMLSNRGVELLDPQTGTVRLSHEWKTDNYRDLQPQVLNGDKILIPTGMGTGTRCIQIKNGEGQLTAEPLWTSKDLKPDFNDFVVFEDHAYGFDSAVFTCIDLSTGKRKWKGGRYGKGQVLLLGDSGLLLVAGEYGDVILLKADPSAHIELSKFQAIEGKTWNHPVVIGDRLYIRNSQEAACFRLPK